MKLVILFLCMVQYVYGQNTQHEYCRLDETPPGMDITTGHGTYGGAYTDQFNLCESLKSVTIESGVNEIISWAFLRATALTTVDFSSANNVKKIGSSAFAYTALTAVTIPDSVTEIDDAAFKSTALTSVTIPSSVTEIGTYAFASSTLTSVDLSGATSLKTIGVRAFYSTGLTSVDLSGATGVTTVGNLVFSSDTDTIYCMTQPDSTGHVSVEALSDALGDTTTIGDSTASYDVYQFRGFHGCTTLKSVKIPASVTMIGYGAFGGSGVTSVDFSGAIALASIGNEVFTSSALTSVDFSGATALETIGYRAFASTPLQTVDLSQATSLKTIEREAFAWTDTLTSVVIPNGVEKIEQAAFSRSQLTSLVIPESVVTIGGTSINSHGAFSFSFITELAILGTPTFFESSRGLNTFSRGLTYDPLQLKRYCFNHSALSIKDQLDISNAVHDCTFWCETGTGQISTNYNCTKSWSTACDAGSYFAPKPAGMQVSMSDTCTPCPSGQFQPNNNSAATSCAPWTTENGKRLVTAGTALADAVWEDAPISPSAMNATWSNMDCESSGQTYTATIGPCVVGKICFENGDVLECPSGTERINETHCSSEKEVVYDALKSHCPL